MNLKLSAKAVLLLSFLSVIIIPFQNCSKVQFKQLEPTEKQASLASVRSDIPLDPIPATENILIPECKFNGVVIPEGQSRTAFQNSKVPFQNICISEERECKKGILSGSYNFSSCSNTDPASCLFNGVTISHGGEVLGYNSSVVEFGKSCLDNSEIRKCSDGVLSGSFNFAACSTTAAQSCLFNGLTVLSGSQTMAYQNSAVAFGQNCISEQRRCENGSLSGSFNNGSCQVDQPSSCSFNGKTIAHGESVAAFAVSTVTFGQSCSKQIESRVCNNGILSGQNTFASCQVDQPAACLFNGKTIAHSESVAAFAVSTVAFGQLCSDQSESRTCNNGVLSGQNTFATCQVDQPAACLFNGKTIAHGEIITAFKASSVSFNATCNSEKRTCSNGQLSGSNEFASCVNEAKPLACQAQTVKWTNGSGTCQVNIGILTHQQSLTNVINTVANLSGKANISCNNGVTQVTGQCAPIVKVTFAATGDCTYFSCPSNAPYLVGCSLRNLGSDGRFLVQYNRSKAWSARDIYIQEGNNCNKGGFSGTLSCSSVYTADLNARSCPVYWQLRRGGFFNIPIATTRTPVSGTIYRPL